MLLLLLAGLSGGDNKVANHLQQVSVTIHSESSQASGVCFSRDGETFIWTAAHVVDNLRRVRKVVDPRTGTERSIVEFDDPKIVRILIENNRIVGRVEMDAEVIRYSDSNHGEDLALLRVRKRDFIRESVVFYLEDEPPDVGTQLFHVGSLLGQVGANSMTTGIMSQHGRLIERKVYDQTTVTSFPGSSGGGVYLTDGRYIGMIVRGAGEGFNLIVPIRRIRAWAKSAGVEWAMNPKVPMPSPAELAKMPIEDVGRTFTPAADSPRP